jgi:hypothetical protein
MSASHATAAAPLSLVLVYRVSEGLPWLERDVRQPCIQALFMLFLRLTTKVLFIPEALRALRALPELEYNFSSRFDVNMPNRTHFTQRFPDITSLELPRSRPIT